MKRALLLTALLALGGCGHSMAEIDAADDASCRASISHQPNPTANAYDLCRANIMSLRRDRAIRVSGN